MGAAESRQRARSATLRSRGQLADRPSVPGKPVLVPNDKHSPEPDVVTIRWEPPLYDGGSPIKGYLVEHRRTGSPHWVRSSPALVRLTELTLSGLEPGWRYQFRVSAQNAAGLSEPGELSDLLTVTLQRTAASAPFFVKELKDTIALENEKAEMSVQVRGTPTPSLSWFKDGVEIFSSRSYRVLTDSETSTLIIHQAALSDEGEIKCSATNRVGYAVTRAKLVLEAPPSIRLPRQYEEGLLFEQGEVIRLKVSVAGRPTPEVSWQLNGEPVPGGGRWEAAHSERYATLRVGEARRTDRGEYQVRATNRIGDDVASFLVTVADKPMSPGRAKVVMTLGRSVTLSWTSPEDDGGCKIGNYIVEYYRLGWNMWLKAATCRQLTTTLGDLIEGSQYKFRVKAENPYGVSEPSTESDVVFIPDPKRGLLEPPDSKPDESADAMGVWLDDKKRAMSPSPTIDEQYGERKTKKKRGPMAPPQLQQSLQPHSMSREGSTSPTPTAEEIQRPVIPRRRGKGERVDIRQEAQEVQEEMALEKKLEERRRIQEQMRFDEREKKIKEPTDEKEMERKHEEKRRVKELLRFEEIKKAEEERNVEEEQRENERKQAKEKVKDEELRKIAERKRKDDLRLSTPLSPRVQHDRFHGSSELMLVLLPQSRATTEERETSKRELFESSLALEGDAVAPPLSLSAPELGSGDPPEPPLVRAAFSSTELLHDRAMARFYQDMAQEESQSQSTARRHSSLQRRRSFGSRTRDLPEVGSLHDLVSSVSLTERLEVTKTTPVFGNKLSESTRPRLEKKKSFSRESSMDSILDESRRKSLITQTSEEDMEYEDSSFDEHEEESEYEEEESIMEEEIEEEEELSTEEKTGSMIVYTSESEEERSSYTMEEETMYRPRVVNMKYNEDSLISAYEGRGPLILGAATKATVPPPVPEHRQEEDVTPLQGNDVKLKPILKRPILDLNYTKKLGQTAIESLTPIVEESKSKSPVSPEKRFEPNFSAAMPKPILKVRDHSMERQSPVPQRGTPMALVEPELNLLSSSRSNLDEGSDYETGVKKKVRIEEPGEVVAREESERKDSIALPQERRDSITPPKQGERRLSLIEELDASKVLISHYSDIVAEYGKGRKPPRKLYVNLEALKAAAEQEEAEAPDIPEITVNEPEPDPEPEPEQEPEPFPEPQPEPEIEETPVVIEEPVRFEYHRISPRTVHFEPKVEEAIRMLEPPLEKPKNKSKEKRRSPSPRKRKPSVTLEKDVVRTLPEKTEMARTSSPPLPLRLHTTAEKKVHSYFDFLMDFSLFILACWLYFFKDERLSIPVLFLMIYRQAHEAFQRKMEALRNKLPNRLLFWRRAKSN